MFYSTSTRKGQIPEVLSRDAFIHSELCDIINNPKRTISQISLLIRPFFQQNIIIL